MARCKRRAMKGCNGCGGVGLICPASPACRIPGLPNDARIVERCDTCWKFESDYDAALSLLPRGRMPAIFTCEDGGEHVAI